MASAPDIGDLLNKIRSERHFICDQFGIDMFGIGGSVARGDARPTSDLDVGVRKARAISLFQVVDAKEALQAKLGLPVDLVFVDALSPYKNEIFMRDFVSL